MKDYKLDEAISLLESKGLIVEAKKEKPGTKRKDDISGKQPMAKGASKTKYNKDDVAVHEYEDVKANLRKMAKKADGTICEEAVRLLNKVRGVTMEASRRFDTRQERIKKIEKSERFLKDKYAVQEFGKDYAKLLGEKGPIFVKYKNTKNEFLYELGALIQEEKTVISQKEANDHAQAILKFAENQEFLDANEHLKDMAKKVLESVRPFFNALKECGVIQDEIVKLTPKSRVDYGEDEEGSLRPFKYESYMNEGAFDFVKNLFTKFSRFVKKIVTGKDKVFEDIENFYDALLDVVELEDKMLDIMYEGAGITESLSSDRSFYKTKTISNDTMKKKIGKKQLVSYQLRHIRVNSYRVEMYDDTDEILYVTLFTTNKEKLNDII